MEVKDAILNRRSIRKFTDYSVTDEEIKEIIEAARWAPSWANTQSWTFVIIKDKNTIKQISDTFSKMNPAKHAAESASALIAVCAKKGLAGCRNGAELTCLNSWFMFDAGLAVQNMCLRAHDLGLGTVIVGLLDHQTCKRIIELPKDHELVVIIPIGKSEEKEKTAPPRKKIETMAHLDSYGKQFIK